MSDEEARRVYAEARLGESVTLGSHPAVLVVDFSCGFTDPECALGSELTAEVEATKRLLDGLQGNIRVLPQSQEFLELEEIFARERAGLNKANGH